VSRHFHLICCLFLLVGAGERLSAEGAGEFTDKVQTLQAVAEEFRARLEIPGQIEVRIVDQDKRLVSVRRSMERHGLFVLSFDQSFLTALSAEEQRAAIAHELGHVWIFTHHPFLQTEALANRKALQLVSEETLEKVYQKVVHFGGKKQELPRAQTVTPVAGLAGAAGGQ